MNKIRNNNKNIKINLTDIFGKKKIKNNQSISKENKKDKKIISLSIQNDIFTLSYNIGKTVEFLRKQAQGINIKIVNNNINLDDASKLMNHLKINFKLNNDLLIQEKINKKPLLADDFHNKPIVISIFGHINHGKTSLLSKIINKEITEPEEITQDLSIYKHNINNKEIFIIDTPGHGIFNVLKFSIFNSTDIFVIVIALHRSVENETKIILDKIVECNFIDKSIIAFTHSDLLQKEEIPIKAKALSNKVYEYIGFSIPFVTLSSKTGEGISQLLDMCIENYELLFLKKVYQLKVCSGEILYKHKQDKINSFLVRLDHGKLAKNSYVVLQNKDGLVLKVKNIINIFDKKFFPLPCANAFGFFYITFDQECNVLPNTLLTGNLSKNEAKSLSIIEFSKNNIAPTVEKTKSIKKLKIKNKISTDIEPEEIIKPTILIKLFIISTSNVTNIAISQYIENNFTNLVKIEKTFVGFEESDLAYIKNYQHTYVVNFMHDQINKKYINEIKKHQVYFMNFNNIYRMIDFIHEKIQSIKENLQTCGKIVKLFRLDSGVIVIGCQLNNGLVHIGDIITFKKYNFKSKVLSLKREKEDIKEACVGYNFGMILTITNNSLEEGDEFVIDM